jgi:hypothetical protein
MSSRPMLACLLLLLLLASPASATITSVFRDKDIDFGRFVSLGSSGTVTVTPVGGRNSTGGIILVPSGGAVAASFTVTGTKNSVYTITLPANNSVLISSGGHNLILTNFTSSALLTGKFNGGKTSMTFTVGATATVAPNSTPGVYSGAFDVSVN